MRPRLRNARAKWGPVAGRVALAALAVGALALSPVRAEQFTLVTAPAPGIGGGTTAFVDAVDGRRIVEIDRAGKVVWQCALDQARFKSDELQRGADLEWIRSDDSFLVAIPFSGIFRIDRKCNVIWQYRTSKVSHDADLLPNGNVLYTYAWDDTSDAQAVEVDPSGRIVWSWRAHGRLDPSWKSISTDGDSAGDLRGGSRRSGGGSGQGGGRGEGYTHANAVVRLADGDTLVSLRNFHRVVRVGRDGAVKRAYGPINRVHDPSLLPDGRLVAADHVPMSVVILGNGPPRVLFSNPIDMKPIRTVEPLANGNFLVAGGRDIVEINGAGAILWHVRVYASLGARVRDGVYKAVRVAK